ncbi:hypothetical protein [Nonomuraea sp. NPDC050202]|jgi:hypothetical protein
MRRIAPGRILPSRHPAYEAASPSVRILTGRRLTPHADPARVAQ